MWTMQAGHNYPGGGFWPIPAPADVIFSPEALAGEGIR
jgi:hypothetical protein